MPRETILRGLLQSSLVFLVCFVAAGDPAPGINEAHYLVKAKHFWDPSWLASDLFVSSGNAQHVFYFAIGWLTQFADLTTTAWIGRLVGWAMLAIGITRLTNRLLATQPIIAPALVAVCWFAGIETCDLAGEWVIGGIEAKVPAYALALLGLSFIVEDRWHSAWPLFGAAAAFHVLVGGWSVIATFIASLILPNRRRQLLSEWAWIVFGGAIASIGLIPVLLMNGAAESETTIEAARIYTYRRLAHHLLPADFDLVKYLAHGLLVLFLLFLAWPLRHRATSARLLTFNVAVLTISLFGLLVGILPAIAPAFAAWLLRFYWFRLEDAVIPLSAGLFAVAVLFAKDLPIRGQTLPGLYRFFAFSGVLAAVAWTSANFLERISINVPPACQQTLLAIETNRTPARLQAVYDSWRETCRWVETNTASTDVFLTPRHQQTFKWFAQRPEVVNWKDVPQDAATLIEWWQRMDRVFPGANGRAFPPGDLETLTALATDYDADYLIVDTRVQPVPLALPQVHPEPTEDHSFFRIYRLPR